jgi:hypothetical protein
LLQRNGSYFFTLFLFVVLLALRLIAQIGRCVVAPTASREEPSYVFLIPPKQKEATQEKQ